MRINEVRIIQSSFLGKISIYKNFIPGVSNKVIVKDNEGNTKWTIQLSEDGESIAFINESGEEVVSISQNGTISNRD